MEIYPDPVPPYERTGAGDAFSSTFTSAIALKKSLPEAMKWGSINSMSVVQYVAAQKGLLTQDSLKKLLDEAPVGWEVEEI
jgi:sugar/nucleoside kinase (ribokinase family)